MVNRNLSQFFIFFLLFTFLGTVCAQEEPKAEDSLKVLNLNLTTKTLQILDTITTQVVSGDLNTTVINTLSKDSIVFDLEDQAIARTADSLWMKELYDSSRFEEVYGSIVNEVIEPLEYKELPTELLNVV